jgi:hypothetical protein
VRETAKQRSSELKDRAAQELPLLPFSRYAGIGRACSQTQSGRVGCALRAAAAVQSSVHVLRQ